MSYLCFFPGRWHPVPATRCTLVASLSEPSSIHSKHGRSCKRQSMNLYQGTEPWGTVKFLPNHSQLMLPWRSSVHTKKSRVLCGETSGVSPAGLGYCSSFVGSRNRALLSLGCSSLSRAGLVDRISAELSPVTSLQLCYLFPFPHVSFPTSKYCVKFLLGPCHVFLPDTSTLVLCKQCPIFIIIFIHTQAALGVVSPRKASDHPGGNSQAPQNCTEERAVDQLCIQP